MSELISGKEALIALANGENVEFQDNFSVWHNAGIHTHAIGLFLNDCYKFRLKPRTITLNGIEVETPLFSLKSELSENELTLVFNDELHLNIFLKALKQELLK